MFMTLFKRTRLDQYLRNIPCMYLSLAQVLEGKKLLKIATDQIKGLRERVFTLEEENQRLKFENGNIQVKRFW